MIHTEISARLPARNLRHPVRSRPASQPLLPLAVIWTISTRGKLACLKSPPTSSELFASGSHRELQPHTSLREYYGRLWQRCPWAVRSAFPTQHMRRQCVELLLSPRPQVWRK